MENPISVGSHSCSANLGVDEHDFSIGAQDSGCEGVMVVTVVNPSNVTVENGLAIVTLSRSANPLVSRVDPSTIYVTDLHGDPPYYNVTVARAGTIVVRVLIPKLEPHGVAILLLHYGGNNPYRNYALTVLELEKRASSARELKDDFNDMSGL